MLKTKLGEYIRVDRAYCDAPVVIIEDRETAWALLLLSHWHAIKVSLATPWDERIGANQEELEALGADWDLTEAQYHGGQ